MVNKKTGTAPASSKATKQKGETEEKNTPDLLLTNALEGEEIIKVISNRAGRVEDIDLLEGPGRYRNN